jgi:hypothetical protein
MTVKERQFYYEWGKTKPFDTPNSNRSTMTAVDGTKVWSKGGYNWLGNAKLL